MALASGSIITGTFANSTAKLRLTVSETSCNGSSNVSVCHAKLEIYGNTLSANSTSPTYSYSINGTTYSGTLSAPFSITGWQTLQEKDISIGHNADGTKTISLSCSITFGYGWNGDYDSDNTLSASGTLVLTDIRHTVTYNANGGSGVPSSQTKNYGSVLTLSSTIPTRDTYTFLGWGKSESTTTVSYNSGGSYSIDEDITLYAIWSKDIILSYNANGGTEEPLSSSVTIYNSTTSYTFTITSDEPERQGYTFLGWDTDPSAMSATYFHGESYTISDSITLYAVWYEHRLTVNYYSNYATAYEGTYDPLNTVNNNNNVLVYTKKYYYDDNYYNGLLDYSDPMSNLYMYRIGYFATGYWVTANGKRKIHQSVSFGTGQELAAALGKSLISGDDSIDIYAEWEPANVAYYNNNGTYILCNTYGKKNGSWQPMLFYGKINNAWRMSGVNE